MIRANSNQSRKKNVIFTLLNKAVEEKNYEGSARLLLTYTPYGQVGNPTSLY